ncbi:radical SAM protein [Athalassotoga sp.]|uniref:radical SAM protein n=1 Tax=Athalassotoga sp. TaxID=2022597 RepID=UPI003D00B2EE
MKILILDGYVDEPAHFGVPPYISTYSRYIAGISKMAGADVFYETIDEFRSRGLSDADILIVVGGVTVPGNYVGGTPMTVEEAAEIAKKFTGKKIIIGSMAYYSVDRSGGVVAKLSSFEGYDFSLWLDYERKLYEILTGNIWNESRYALVKVASVEGAEITRLHPNFPALMCEIELGLGCEKPVKCSFCTEPLWGNTISRPVEDVIEEVGALSRSGCKYFRLGRISNIFAYMAKKGPDSKAIEALYTGIRSSAPDLKVLHTDNANPGYIYSNMKSCEEIAGIISYHNTPGDVLSMGVESFDPRVITMNNLKIGAEQFIEVVRMINSVGGKRIDGVPKLLPGINLLYGLTGETKTTYDINFDVLMKILNEGLLVRRVNIRKVMAFPGTPLFEKLKGKTPKVNDSMYKHHKFMVRKFFDHEMIKRVFPAGTILRDVIIEYTEGKISYGRQIGTYALLVGIPKILKKGSVLDCVITDHGQRSITALPIPIRINHEDYDLLKWIPSAGFKASELVLKRPFNSFDEMILKTGIKFPEWIREMVSFER